MIKILVTGANGQLGSELKELVVNHPINQSVNPNFTFIDIDDLDLINKEAVINYLNKNSFDWIINCAAYTAVDKAESEPELAMLVNKTAVENIVEGAKINQSKIIHISTDFVFDGKKNTPYTEEDEPNPINVYGKTKLEGERVLINNYDKFIIIRTSWLYSSYGNNFVKTILRLAKERDEIKVVSDQIGSPTYAADLAEVILKIIQKVTNLENKQNKEEPTIKHSAIQPISSLFGIYHYSNEGIASWYEFAKAIFEINGVECKVKPIPSKEYPTPATRPFYSVMDKSKIKSTFGVEIPHWQDSLRSCLAKLK